MKTRSNSSWSISIPSCSFLFSTLTVGVLAQTTPSVIPITNKNIHEAVDFWILNSSAAQEFFGHIRDWDVSQVTVMRNLFEDEAMFNDDISLWDVSNVFLFSDMFHGASSFNVDISSWRFGEFQTTDASGVFPPSAAGMFQDAISFDQDLNSWNVSGIVYFDNMFAGATSFNGDIRSWNVGKASSMDGMFQGATSFNQTLCWDINRCCISVDAMFCESGGGRFDDRCANESRQTSAKCPPPTIAPVPAVWTSFPTAPEPGRCSIGDVFSNMKPWVYGMGAGLMFLTLGCTFWLSTKIDSGNQNSARIAFEAIFKFFSDANMVLLLVFSVGFHFFGTEKECETRETLLPGFTTSIAIYTTDVVMDINALIWSSAHGVHARHYDAAQYEGLERLHGTTMTLPFLVYWLAGVSNVAIGGHSIAVTFTALGFVFVAMPMVLLLMPIYMSRHVPGFSLEAYCCQPCWVLRKLNFRNDGPTPMYGPRWGAWARVVAKFALVLMGIAGAILSVASDDPLIATCNVLLSIFECIRLFLPSEG